MLRGSLRLASHSPHITHAYNTPRPAIASCCLDMALEKAFARLRLRPSSICHQCRRTMASSTRPPHEQSATSAFTGTEHCLYTSIMQVHANSHNQSSSRPAAPKPRTPRAEQPTLPPPPPHLPLPALPPPQQPRLNSSPATPSPNRLLWKPRRTASASNASRPWPN